MTTSRTTTALVSKVRSASKHAPRLTRLALALGTLLTPVWAVADTLPTGGQVVSGAAQINAPSSNAMTINQSSDRAVVNWDSFSIGSGNRVDIQQPSAESALLNRVTGDTTSQIHGQLNANGRVFVVNPNGIFIGPTGQVNSGSFVASTLGIRTDDFMTGETVFEGNGASATVENAGTVQVVTGGYAALIGGKVKNSGTIQAPLGFVGLGSGERVTLDLAGDGFLQVAVPTNSDDDGLDALIENSGTIQANGGTVQISAATARNAARHAINLSGVVEARTVSGRNGRITLGGGGGGRVTVSGKVRTSTRPAIQVTQSARPAARPERGGDITITGQNISLAGATMDASGTDGGGTIRIGGDFAGAGDLPRAEHLNVDQASVLLADALTQGDGGRIVLWSDQSTTFTGNMSVRGGDQGGNGGFAEVSSKLDLTYAGLVDARAPNGQWGEVLLDPTNVTIAEIGGIPNVLTADFVEDQLALGDFTVTTNYTDPDNPNDTGIIRVVAPIFWTDPTRLTLDANDTIIINDSITATNGTLRLFALGSTPITTGVGGDIDVDTFHLSIGSWEQIGSDIPDFSADNFALGSSTEFLRALGGTGDFAQEGGSDDPFLITDVYGLQGVPTLGSFYFFALANDIDASGTSDWTDVTFPEGGPFVSGFVPMDFTGILDGQRYSINNLFSETTDIGSTGEAGLFSRISASSSVFRLDITNADISGGPTGILAGVNEGFIAGVSVTGDVTTFGSAGGGLVGENAGNGEIVDSFAIVDVTDAVDPSSTFSSPAGTVDLGGLVGTNFSIVERSNSDGSVSHTVAFEGNSGGLVGRNLGLIADAYSDASVTASSPSDSAEARIGGVVGRNSGVIENVIATGPVAATGACCEFVDEGGVVGADSGDEQSILSSFWDPARTGQSLSGQDGETEGATNSLGQFLGAVPGDLAFFNDADAFVETALAGGWSFADDWSYPLDGSDQSRLYSTSPVINAFNPSSADVEFTYNGTVNHLLPLADYNGGPSVFEFGPLGDSGLPPTTDAPVVLSAPDVGEQTFAFDTVFVSTLGQTYSVRSRSNIAEVLPAPLVITADDQDKAFGTEFVFAGTEFTVEGLLAGDTVTSATLTSVGAAADAPQTGDAGVAIVITDPLGTGLDNYEITLVNGIMIIAPGRLTITANDQTKTYGETFVFAGTEFTVAGLAEGDSVDSVTLTSAGAAPDAQVADGPFLITPSDPVGTGLERYTIVFEDGTMTLVRAPLTVTADNQLKQQGQLFTFAGTEFTTEGLLNDDEVTSAVLTSDAAAADASADDSPFDILVGELTGSGLDNYDITRVSGVFEVNNIITTPEVNPIPPGASTIPNPADQINVAFPGDGSSGSSGTQQAGSAPQQRGLQEAENTLAVVDAISTDLENAIASCGSADQDFTNYMACLSESLDTYSNALDQIADDLPSSLNTVSATIRTARDQVNAATARAQRRLAGATSEAERRAIRRDAINEARGAISQAQSEIRKAISLIRADDPEVQAVQQQTGARIVQAFDTVDSQLARAVEL